MDIAATTTIRDSTRTHAHSHTCTRTLAHLRLIHSARSSVAPRPSIHFASSSPLAIALFPPFHYLAGFVISSPFLSSRAHPLAAVALLTCPLPTINHHYKYKKGANPFSSIHTTNQKSAPRKARCERCTKKMLRLTFLTWLSRSRPSHIQIDLQQIYISTNS